jgi:hypothetical protein
VLIFTAKLIFAAGAKTPAGGRGWGDPTGALAPRRLPGTARGKRSACIGNQQPRLTEPHLKKGATRKV